MDLPVTSDLDPKSPANQCGLAIHLLVIVLGEPLRAKYYGGLEKTTISHDRKYCAVIG